ncbi:MAG: SgcJ/EcaC family oxidoreductase [Candidatus Deferrimicrobiaceae bacterium]
MKVMEPQDMNAAFEEAYNSGDIERLMALYEPDAVMAPSPGKRAVGHFAIREVLLRLLAINGRMTCRNLYCMRVDRIALLQAEWKLAGTRPDGKPVEMSSRTSEVVRQQEDGSWRYIIDHAFASD